MKEIMNSSASISEVEQVLSRCIIVDGKLVPAPDVIRGQLASEVVDDTELPQTDRYSPLHPAEVEAVSAGANERSRRLRVGLTRTALVGAMIFIPLQSADAFISNRSFFEVNIIEDGVHAAENAAIIGDNVATTFNAIKSTTENIVKLANGGK